MAVRTWAVDGVLRCTLPARAVEGDPARGELEAWGERCLGLALAPGWDCWGLDREEALLRPLTWGKERDGSLEDLKIMVTGKLVET